MKGLLLTLVAALIVYGFLMYLLTKWGERKQRKRCRNYKREEKASGPIYLYINQEGKIAECNMYAM